MQNGGDRSPRFRDLNQAEIEAILARNHVGRLAYARGNQIDIQPVHYVYSDGWLYGRTSEGSKYEKLAGTAYQWWPVAFEVDEVEGIFSWRSVLINGGFYVLSPDGAEEERQAWEKGLGLLRGLLPETLREGDPVPFRNVLFRIAVQEASGRECIPPGEPEP